MVVKNYRGDKKPLIFVGHGRVAKLVNASLDRKKGENVILKQLS